MTEPNFAPRLFTDEASIYRLGEGLLACTLARGDWTHEAHLATCMWLVHRRPDLDAEKTLPGIIRSFNESLGGVNDDYQGYHETLTQLYLAGVRAHVEESEQGASFLKLVNRLLQSARGTRQWPLHFYSDTRLFSVPARRYFVTPDRRAFWDADAGWQCKPRVVAMDIEG